MPLLLAVHGGESSVGAILAPGNPALWFRADTIVGTTGVGLATWTNIGGSGGNNAAQTTVSERPVLQGNVQNGKQALQFTSESSQFLRCSTSVFSSKGTRHIFAAFAGAASGVNQVNSIAGQTSGDVANVWFQMQSRTNIGSSGTPYLAGYGNDLGGTDFTTEWAIGYIGFSSVTSRAELWKNGSKISSGEKGTLNTIDSDFAIGTAFAAAREYHGGYIGEVLVYTLALTSAQIEAIFEEMCDRWGITYTTAATT